MRYDAAYENSKHIPGGEGYPPRWAASAAAFRDGLGPRARLGRPYGSDAAEWFDLFQPEGTAEGTLIFIHGGYWLRFGPRDFSHLAVGALARGWAVAMPAYTLAPTARIAGMTRQIAQALDVIAGETTGPIVLCGHSAGGHLAARMACSDVALPDAVLGRLIRVVSISPVADLRPLRETAMQVVLAITPQEALGESPVLLPRRPHLPIHVWVGAEERPAFLDQSRRLGNAWACPVTVEAGRHHFDVIEGMERESPLLSALLG